jgi:UDP-N-acetylmuramoyl-L-alanyl-D-glutamate--2,6-diaminopimelate ligase
MRLSKVIEGTGARGEVREDADVAAVTADSRAVKPGTLFCAVAGEKADGHTFAQAAARAGAVAVIAERQVPCEPAPLFIAESSRRAMALAAANLHEHPGRKLGLVGITGTNGKTTVTYLVEACARAAGVEAGVIGTVGYRFAGQERAASHTTPDPVALQALLSEMVAAKVQIACLEVSSHAIHQERVAGLSFRTAGFTNLTRDHLDYHGTLEAYFAEKKRLFTELLAPDGLAVINVDDPAGGRLASELQRSGRRVWGSSRQGAGELRAPRATISLAGIEARVESPAGALQIRSPLVGAHNLENLLTAIGLALGAGLPLSAVESGLAACAGAPGRLERIDGRGVTAFVDYAHTDDALARACAALRAVAPRRLIVVFGCGGDRDRGKRPLMGHAAGTAADLVVVTSDNPRTEDPASIIGEIVPGVEGAGLSLLHPGEAAAGARGYAMEADRRAAIELALRSARPGDAVLIAGKGHESYQIIGTTRRHFDDREEARRILGPT